MRTGNQDRDEKRCECLCTVQYVISQIEEYLGKRELLILMDFFKGIPVDDKETDSDEPSKSVRTAKIRIK